MANGIQKIIIVMAVVFKYGQTVRNMKVIGNKIIRMEKENYFILTVIYTMAIGKMTYQMVQENTQRKTGNNIQANGKMENKKEKEKKLGQMVPNLKENIKTGKNADMVF